MVMLQSIFIFVQSVAYIFQVSPYYEAKCLTVQHYPTVVENQATNCELAVTRLREFKRYVRISLADKQVRTYVS